MIREQTQRTAGTGPNRAEEIYEKCLKRDPLTAEVLVLILGGVKLPGKIIHAGFLPFLLIHHQYTLFFRRCKEEKTDFTGCAAPRPGAW